MNIPYPGCRGQSPGTSYTLDDMAKSLDVISIANLLLPVCGVISHSLLGNLDWLLLILHV